MARTPHVNEQLNLTAYRGSRNALAARPAGGRSRRQLVGALFAVASAAVALNRLRRVPMRRRLLAIAGWGLAWWALAETGRTGRGPVRRAGLRATQPPPDDRVVEASDESFPASDAPSWTPTVGTRPGAA